MLVVPEPAKLKNFVIGLKASKVAPAVKGKSEQVVKATSAPSKAGASGDEYISVKEAAEILKCSDKTVRNYYGDGRLKHKKVGQRKVLILKSSVDKLLEG
jgi:excisionase family DNA binding protein